MPVPSRSLKPNMVVRRKVTILGPNQTNQQEQSPDHNMQTVKARRHVKDRWVNPIFKSKCRMMIFGGLQAQKRNP